MKKIVFLVFVFFQFSCFGQEKEYYRFSYDYFVKRIEQSAKEQQFYIKKDSVWIEVTAKTVYRLEIDAAVDWKITETNRKNQGAFSEGGVYEVTNNKAYEKEKLKWLHQYYRPIWEIKIRELKLDLKYDTSSNGGEIKSEKIFDIPENSAEFPGGLDEMHDFFNQSVKANVWHKYPKGAKVFVQFIIQKDGRVGEIEIIRGVNENIDAEVILSLSFMPNWIPARQKGKNVASRFIIPIQLK